MVQQAGGRPLHRVLEQHPRQKSTEQENRIVAPLQPGRRLDPHAHLKHENPANQQDHGVYYAPYPARSRADKPLREVPADELEQQVPPFH